MFHCIAFTPVLFPSKATWMFLHSNTFWAYSSICNEKLRPFWEVFLPNYLRNIFVFIHSVSNVANFRDVRFDYLNTLAPQIWRYLSQSVFFRSIFWDRTIRVSPFVQKLYCSMKATDCLISSEFTLHQFN